MSHIPPSRADMMEEKYKFKVQKTNEFTKPPKKVGTEV
jgi:hypothetical protein